MGSKHPQEVLKKLNAGKCEFILAARHLIRQGIVNSPADAIRYMEENNTNVDEVCEKFIISKQKSLTKPEKEKND